MDELRAARLVQAALRCYPARWRRRHGDEAAEVAALLIRDGTPAGSIAFSYLAGAARAWLTPRPGRRLSAVAAALLGVACALGVSAGLLASTVPARAASTSQTSQASQASQASQRHQATQTSHATHCQPGSSGFGRGTLPAVGRPQVIIHGGGHDRSC